MMEQKKQRKCPCTAHHGREACGGSRRGVVEGVAHELAADVWLAVEGLTVGGGACDGGQAPDDYRAEGPHPRRGGAPPRRAASRVCHHTSTCVVHERGTMTAATGNYPPPCKISRSAAIASVAGETQPHAYMRGIAKATLVSLSCMIPRHVTSASCALRSVQALGLWHWS